MMVVECDIECSVCGNEVESDDELEEYWIDKFGNYYCSSDCIADAAIREHGLERVGQNKH